MKFYELKEGHLLANPQNSVVVKKEYPYDWYKIGTQIANLDNVTQHIKDRNRQDIYIQFYGGEKEKEFMMKRLGAIGYDVQDADGYRDMHFDENIEGSYILRIRENFADGKKKVNEVLDKPAPYTWRKNEFGFPTAEAKELGLHISFDGRNQPDWEVSFYREQEDGSFVMNHPTGQGQEFQVFATVNAAIKDFLKMHDDVEGLTLDARKDGGVDGQGRVSLYRRMMNNYAKKLGWGFEEWDQGQMVMMGIYKPRTNENFADGKVKGKSRPGRVKRSGASCNGSVTDLRKRAKNSSGEKAKMYHWCANMKSGRSKKGK
jgi:hypothetical protein